MDIAFADNQTTVTVDQTTNGGVWMLLGTFPCEAGNSNSVTIRNNTGTTGKYVIADAVQFVPHLSPWGNATNTLADYTVTTFADNISGTSLDATKWAIALGRPNVSVADGKISLDLEYIGTTPIAQATAAELKDSNNWKKGAVQPLNDQKFGYYEARFRVNQDGGGVDNAYWFPASMEAGHWEGYEYDVPEIFTQPVPNFGSTDVGYGIWNHVNGAHLWDNNANPPSYYNVGNSWGLTNYHTFGFEWRTDNSLVIYFDGVQLSRALPSKVNALATILPAVPVLSTWVGDWMQPTTNLDGQSMKIDYLRCYQKPGWLGAVSSAWTNAANWGAGRHPRRGLRGGVQHECRAIHRHAADEPAGAVAVVRPRESFRHDDQRPGRAAARCRHEQRFERRHRDGQLHHDDADGERRHHRAKESFIFQQQRQWRAAAAQRRHQRRWGVAA